MVNQINELGYWVDVPQLPQYSTECVNSSVGRFDRNFLSKFPRPVGRATAAVQPSKKKIAKGTYTNTFKQTSRLTYWRTLYIRKSTPTPTPSHQKNQSYREKKDVIVRRARIGGSKRWSRNRWFGTIWPRQSHFEWWREKELIHLKSSTPLTSSISSSKFTF